MFHNFLHVTEATVTFDIVLMLLEIKEKWILMLTFPQETTIRRLEFSTKAFSITMYQLFHSSLQAFLKPSLKKQTKKHEGPMKCFICNI